MLEQVWKNVIGNKLDYTIKDGLIEVYAPMGNLMAINDFGTLLDSVEIGLGKKLEISAYINDEHSIRFRVSEHAFDVIDPFVEVPKKGTRKKVEEEVTE